MPRYEVTVQETKCNVYRVEADNEEEAQQFIADRKGTLLDESLPDREIIDVQQSDEEV